MDLTTITELLKKKIFKTLLSEPVYWNFAIAQFASPFCHIIWGSGWVTVQCIKMAKTCINPKGKAKTIWDRNVFIKSKVCLSASLKHILLEWWVKSDTSRVFWKIWWERENEITYTHGHAPAHTHARTHTHMHTHKTSVTLWLRQRIATFFFKHTVQ